jgi:hypothetical protein
MKYDKMRNVDVVTVGDTSNDTIVSTIKDVNIDFVLELASSGIYKRPLESFIREIVSNAVDANVENNVDDPVLITIYKDLIDDTYNIKIQDKGKGMDPEFIKKTYMSIFESTRRKSNDFYGLYGAGSKSPLAYKDEYNIVTIVNGIKYKWLVYKGENRPEATLISQENTDESSGTTVIVELEKQFFINTYNIRNFIGKLKSELGYFNSVFLKFENIHFYLTNNKWNNDYKIYYNDIFKIRSDNEDRQFNKLKICIGEVSYPFDKTLLSKSSLIEDKSFLNKIENLPIGLNFKIGDLKVIPSREDIKYTNDDIIAINNKLKELKIWFFDKIKDKIFFKKGDSFIKYYNNVIDRNNSGKATILYITEDTKLYVNNGLIDSIIDPKVIKKIVDGVKIFFTNCNVYTLHRVLNLRHISYHNEYKYYRSITKNNCRLKYENRDLSDKPSLNSFYSTKTVVTSYIEIFSDRKKIYKACKSLKQIFNIKDIKIAYGIYKDIIKELKETIPAFGNFVSEEEENLYNEYLSDKINQAKLEYEANKQQRQYRKKYLLDNDRIKHYFNDLTKNKYAIILVIKSDDFNSYNAHDRNTIYWFFQKSNNNRKLLVLNKTNYDMFNKAKDLFNSNVTIYYDFKDAIRCNRLKRLFNYFLFYKELNKIKYDYNLYEDRANDVINSIKSISDYHSEMLNIYVQRINKYKCNNIYHEDKNNPSNFIKIIKKYNKLTKKQKKIISVLNKNVNKYLFIRTHFDRSFPIANVYKLAKICNLGKLNSFQTIKKLIENEKKTLKEKYQKFNKS